MPSFVHNNHKRILILCLVIIIGGVFYLNSNWQNIYYNISGSNSTQRFADISQALQKDDLKQAKVILDTIANSDKTKFEKNYWHSKITQKEIQKAVINTNKLELISLSTPSIPLTKKIAHDNQNQTQILQQALKLAPLNIKLGNQTLKAQSINNPSQAIKTAQSMLNNYPNDANILLQSAKIFELNGYQNRALIVYKKILNINPNNSYAQKRINALQ